LEKADKIFEGIHYATGRPIRLGVSKGIIVSVDGTGPESISGIPGGSDMPSGFHEEFSENLPVIAPGMIDLQVNGFMGVDFNDPGLTADQVEQASLSLLRSGVTGYHPTVITGPPERTGRLLQVISEAVHRGNLASRILNGIHVEGPFISREDGPRGAHPAEFCMDPDIELVKRWQKMAGGLIRILTLAPELPGSEALIRTCLEMGIVVGIGHTKANTDQIRRAADAGATLSTHLGNGSHAVLPRHPNYIWDQLAEDRLYASMIADGFHLPDEVLKVFIRAKGEKAILVSDCMTYSGMPPGVYESPSTGKVRLTTGGKLHREGEPGTLAGSASMLIQGVRRIARIQGLAFAWDMASVHPSRLMNDAAGEGLQKGAPADLVLLGRGDPDPEILGVFKGGESV